MTGPALSRQRFVRRIGATIATVSVLLTLFLVSKFFRVLLPPHGKPGSALLLQKIRDQLPAADSAKSSDVEKSREIADKLSAELTRVHASGHEREIVGILCLDIHRIAGQLKLKAATVARNEADSLVIRVRGSSQESAALRTLFSEELVRRLPPPPRAQEIQAALTDALEKVFAGFRPDEAYEITPNAAHPGTYVLRTFTWSPGLSLETGTEHAETTLPLPATTIQQIVAKPEFEFLRTVLISGTPP